MEKTGNTHNATGVIDRTISAIFFSDCFLKDRELCRLYICHAPIKVIPFMRAYNCGVRRESLRHRVR